MEGGIIFLYNYVNNKINDKMYLEIRRINIILI